MRPESTWEHVKDFEDEELGVVVRLTRLPGTASQPPLHSLRLGRVSLSDPSRLSQHVHILTRRPGGLVSLRDDLAGRIGALIGQASETARGDVEAWQRAKAHE